MARTSSSTSVAVSRRPSSRAPACATFTMIAVKIAANNAAAGCFLFGIKEPSTNARSLPQDGGGGLLQFGENSRRIGIAVMRAIILRKPLARQNDFRMQRSHRL